MKLDLMRPAIVVDINALALEHVGVRMGAYGLRLGALARIADLAADPAVRRDFPVIAQSLDLAARPQTRDMASLGGNVLQRTRCAYFRDVSRTDSNKRDPRSGCAPIGGHRQLSRRLRRGAGLAGHHRRSGRPRGCRVMAFEDLHRLPGETPHFETNLKPGELITGFSVRPAPGSGARCT